MNPTAKKYFEIFLVLGLLYYFIYMIAYIFFLDSYCNKYSQNIKNTKKLNLYTLSSCNSNYFCKLDKNNAIYELGKLKNYTCTKKKINRYEKQYYIDIYNNFINK